MLTVMGEGLSPLQRCILDVAIENRRTGRPTYWGWRHAFKHQVMVHYFGWHRRGRRASLPGRHGEPVASSETATGARPDRVLLRRLPADAAGARQGSCACVLVGSLTPS